MIYLVDHGKQGQCLSTEPWPKETPQSSACSSGASGRCHEKNMARVPAAPLALAPVTGMNV